MRTANAVAAKPSSGALDPKPRGVVKHTWRADAAIVSYLLSLNLNTAYVKGQRLAMKPH